MYVLHNNVRFCTKLLEERGFMRCENGSHRGISRASNSHEQLYGFECLPAAILASGAAVLAKNIRRLDPLEECCCLLTIKYCIFNIAGHMHSCLLTVYPRLRHNV
jgi:hypothetical protein